ncbi:hypothetical protein H0X09_00845 [Candidatus Saccharibacteria bacterium]|nr:hypothetical protein [Candidatus Saccharibacteria bacterium]
MAILRIPFLLVLVLGIVLAAYFYVSRAEDVTQIKDGTVNAIEQAENLQDQTQDVKNRANDIQDKLDQ